MGGEEFLTAHSFPEKGRGPMKKRRTYGRIRFDSGHHRRILAAAAVLGLMAFVPVGLRLYHLMVVQYDYYANLALRNQTRTTVVTAHRGTVYDRNMNILACSVSVENVYLDPHELKQSKADIPSLSRELAGILDLDAAWIEKQARDLTMRYKLLKAAVDQQTGDRIRNYINSNGNKTYVPKRNTSSFGW